MHQCHVQHSNQYKGIVTLSGWNDNIAMSKSKNLYYGNRLPPEVISHSIWLYHRFLSALVILKKYSRYAAFRLSMNPYVVGV